MAKKCILLNSLFLCLFFSLFISCKNNNKLFLSDNIYYLSAARTDDLTAIQSKEDSFQKMDSNELNNLSKFITKNTYLWLEIPFEIPENLKNKTLGLTIPYLRTSSECYLNGENVGSYGLFPPNEFSPGFVSNYFQLPEDILNQNGKNIIYLKIWVAGLGAMSKNLYVSDAKTAQFHSNVITFFNSKIILLFSGSMFLVFTIYLLMFLGLKKVSRHQEHIIFSLLNFYTIHFLLMFFIADIPFFKPEIISYITFLKLFFLCGAYVTIYFANGFILCFINVTQTKKTMITRLVILIIAMLITILSPTYEVLSYTIIFSLLLSIFQFYFSIPKLYEHYKNPATKGNVINLLKGFSPVLICLPLDLIIRIIFNYKDLPILTIYGWQFTNIVFMFFLITQFNKVYINNIKLSNKLSEFNLQLEHQVEERTKELSEKNIILTEGLHAVSNVQQNFLPPRKQTFKGWEIAISYTPLVNDVSGDLYDYYYTGNNLDGIGIFDVSGHGIPSGLMTILAKGIISQHFLNGITMSEPISQVLEKINKTYIQEKVNVENYITGLLFRFSNFNKNEICSVEVANAGHPHPYLYKADTKEIIEIQYEDPRKQYGMIGLNDLPVSFPPVSFRMSPNDIIVCFTDGLTDVQNPNHEDFGKQRLKDIILKYADESAANIREHINTAIFNFSQKKKPNDDITFIVLKRTNSKDFIEELPNSEFELEMLY